MVAMIQPPTQASTWKTFWMSVHSFSDFQPGQHHEMCSGLGDLMFEAKFWKLPKLRGDQLTLLPISLVFCQNDLQQHHWAECRPACWSVQTFFRSMLHMPIFEWRERENQQRHEQKGESCRIHGYFDVNRLFWGWESWFLREIWA